MEGQLRPRENVICFLLRVRSGPNWKKLEQRGDGQLRQAINRGFPKETADCAMAILWQIFPSCCPFSCQEREDNGRMKLVDQDQTHPGTMSQATANASSQVSTYLQQSTCMPSRWLW